MLAYDAVAQLHRVAAEDGAGRETTIRLHGAGSSRFRVLARAPAFGVEWVACALCRGEEAVRRQTRCCGKPVCDACWTGVATARGEYARSVGVHAPPDLRRCPFCRSTAEA